MGRRYMMRKNANILMSCGEVSAGFVIYQFLSDFSRGVRNPKLVSGRVNVSKDANRRFRAGAVCRAASISDVVSRLSASVAEIARARGRKPQSYP